MTLTFNVPTRLIRSIGALACVLGYFAITADTCGSPPANSAETHQVTDQQGIYLNHQPVHTYQWSNEREILQQIYDQRVSGNLNTWTVWISNDGKPLGMCPSKGYPIPYSTELTNPHQITYQHFDGNGGQWEVGVVDQMDPNGLYPVGMTNATWVTCISPDGSLHPQYIEPLVMTYTYPIEIRNGQIVATGAATDASKITVSGAPQPTPVAPKK